MSNEFDYKILIVDHGFRTIDPEIREFNKDKKNKEDNLRVKRIEDYKEIEKYLTYAEFIALDIRWGPTQELLKKGFSMLKELKLDYNFKHSIVMLSGYTDEKYIQEAKELGARGYISKSEDVAILNLIKEWYFRFKDDNKEPYIYDFDYCISPNLHADRKRAGSNIIEKNKQNEDEITRIKEKINIDLSDQSFDQIIEIIRLCSTGQKQEAIAPQVGLKYKNFVSKLTKICECFDVKTRQELYKKATQLGLIS